MNLEDSNLGDVFLDDTTWKMLPGVPAFNIAAPTATGACDTAVLYKFTPPPCIKTVRFQITTNASAGDYAYGVVDAYDISQSKCDQIEAITSFIRLYNHSLGHLSSHSLVLSFTRYLDHSFTRSLVSSFTPSVVQSYTRSLVHSFSPSLVL